MDHLLSSTTTRTTNDFGKQRGVTTTREKYVLRQEGGSSLFERMKIGDGEERREGEREGETQGMKGGVLA